MNKIKNDTLKKNIEKKEECCPKCNKKWKGLIHLGGRPYCNDCGCVFGEKRY